MISNQILAKTAVYIGFFGVSSSLYIFYTVQKRLKSSEYFKESMNLLQQNNIAVKYLGQPIKHGYLNLSDSENNFCDGLKAQFEIPVKGLINSGTLHLWARRENTETTWDVYKLELSPASDSSKRLVIKREE